MYGTGLQHSLALAELPLRKLWKRRRKHITSSTCQQPKQPPSSTSKVSLGDFDQGVVRKTIASMYILKKVLLTLNNIRTELKQSIGYTRIKDRLRKDPSYAVCLHTLWVNGKVLMKRQDIVLSRIRYLHMVRELREAGYTFVYTDET